MFFLFWTIDSLAASMEGVENFAIRANPAAHTSANETMNDSLDEPRRLGKRASELHDIYIDTGSKSELEEAISTERKAISLLPANHIDLARHLNNLSIYLHELYRLNYELEILDERIKVAREAIQTTPNNLLDRFALFHLLVLLLYDKYEHVGEVKDLRESMDVADMIVSGISLGHEDRAKYLNSLGIITIELFKYTDDEKDLQRTIDVTEVAVQLTSSENTDDLLAYLQNLSQALQIKHCIGERRDRLERAIEVAKRAVEISEGSPCRARCCYTLGSIMLDSFEITKNMSDLDEGILALKEAQILEPEDEGDQLLLWMDLAAAMDLKYGVTGLVSDLEEAIDFGKRAAKITPKEHQQRPDIYASLIARYGKRYHITGSVADLEEAVEIGTKELETTPKDHPFRGRLLHNTGSRFFDQYESSGNVAYLDKALHYTRQAAEFIPKGDKDWVIAASSFAAGLDAQYRRTAAMADLEEAIEIFTEVLQVSQGTMMERIEYSHNLALDYRLKYIRTDKTGDLEKATELASFVVAASQDHPNRGAFLSSLAHILRERSGELHYLEESIKMSRMAVDITPAKHTARFNRLDNLADSLREKHIETNSLNDLDEAIQRSEEALGLIGDDDMNRSLGLYTLGFCQWLRYEVTKNQEDARQGFSNLKLSLKQTQCPPVIRIVAGRFLMFRYVVHSMWEEGYEASKLVTDLIPRLVRRFLANLDKQDLLSEVGGLASDCAALALQTGESPMTALNLLEKERGVLATSLEDLGVDIVALETSQPQLQSDS